MLKYWHLFLFAIIITLLSNQLSLMGPEFSGSAIDAISAEGGVDFAAVKCLYAILHRAFFHTFWQYL